MREFLLDKLNFIGLPSLDFRSGRCGFSRLFRVQIRYLNGLSTMFDIGIVSGFGGSENFVFGNMKAARRRPLMTATGGVVGFGRVSLRPSSRHIRHPDPCSGRRSRGASPCSTTCEGACRSILSAAGFDSAVDVPKGHD